MKKTVFISHITEEKDLAIHVKVFIEEAFLGLIDVFISSDEHSISLGEKWLNDITDSLKDCTIEIIICSPISIKRPWINFEAGAGWIRDIPVIPLCHSGIEPSRLPLPLNLLQGANLNDSSSLKLLLPVLSKAIDSKEPSYDFSNLINNVLDFEKKYTYWDECNRVFGDINKLNPQIISGLRNEQNIKIDLTEINARSFENLLPFLKSNNLLDFRKSGITKMTGTGTIITCEINILPNLSNTINDPNFKY